MLPIIIRGVKLSTLAEAEAFVSLSSSNKEDRVDQRKVAYKLFDYFTNVSIDHKKAEKYLLLALADIEGDKFEITLYEIFGWYHLGRVFVGCAHRLLALLGKPFLPLWYVFTGLAYIPQAIVAYNQQDQETGHYWSVWGVFNTIACLATYATVVGLTGGSFMIATALIAIAGLAFDVEFDIYKFLTETKNLENLYKELDKDPKNKLLAESLRKRINAIKSGRKENFAITSSVMIGGSLFILSSFFPPVAFTLATVGATIMLTALVYAIGRRTQLSCTAPDGFLKNFLINPIKNLFKPKDETKSKAYRFQNNFSNSYNTSQIFDKILTAKNDIAGIATLDNIECRQFKKLVHAETNDEWNHYLLDLNKEQQDLSLIANISKAKENQLNILNSPDTDVRDLEGAREAIDCLQNFRKELNGQKEHDLNKLRIKDRNAWDCLTHSYQYPNTKKGQLKKLFRLLNITSYEVYQSAFAKWEKNYDKHPHAILFFPNNTLPEQQHIDEKAERGQHTQRMSVI